METMEYDEAALQTVRETRLLISEYDVWLFDEVRKHLGQRILEVGCGLGNLSRHMVDRELVVGIDPPEQTIIEVRQKFIAYPNLQFFPASITDPDVLSLSRFNFDTAISLNVLEHIEDDEQAIRYMAQLVNPGGKLILIVPAHAALYGPMDSSIGHYRRYTAGSMGQLMEKAGLVPLEYKYLNMVGALGWLVNGRILRRRVPPTGQLRIANRVFPYTRRLENRFSPPFGISLLCVAQKPD